MSHSGIITNHFYTFIGEVDKLPKDISSRVGDICFYNGYEYVYTGKWEKFGTVDSRQEETTEKRILPTTCSRCGAALNNGKCEYCGSNYRGYTWK